MQGIQYTAAGTLEPPHRNFVALLALNVLGDQVDKNQMLGMEHLVNDMTRPAGVARKIFELALELLSGCGMILRARLRTSPGDGLGHPSLSDRVHYSLVILPNGLNLSGGSHV